MAIKADNPNSIFGAALSGVYYRIIQAVVTREEPTPFTFYVVINLSGFLGDPKQGRIQPIETRSYRAILSDVESMAGDTFMSKCYAWVMAQPDMSGSVAV